MPIMPQTYTPTTDELRDAWRRSGLWRRGHTFQQDVAVPCIALGLRNVVIASHKQTALPEQRALQL